MLPSDLTAWAAGIAGPDEARQWGLPQGQRRPPAHRPGPAGRRPGPDLRDRRHRAHRRPPAAPAGPAGPADGTACGGADPPPGGRAGDGPVQLPRQGHHGHHRQPVGGGPAEPRNPVPRRGGLVRLAGPAPDHPAGRPEPDQRADQLVLALPVLAARRRHHRRRRPARAERRGQLRGRRGWRGRARRRGRGVSGGRCPAPAARRPHPRRAPRAGWPARRPGSAGNTTAPRTLARLPDRLLDGGVLGPRPAQHPGPGPEQVGHLVQDGPQARRPPRRGAVRSAPAG